MMQVRQLYRVDEVAKIMCVSRRTVYNYVELGKLESIRTPGGLIRINSKQIEKYLQNENEIENPQH